MKRVVYFCSVFVGEIARIIDVLLSVIFHCSLGKVCFLDRRSLDNSRAIIALLYRAYPLMIWLPDLLRILASNRV